MKLERGKTSGHKKVNGHERLNDDGPGSGHKIWKVVKFEERKRKRQLH